MNKLHGVRLNRPSSLTVLREKSVSCFNATKINKQTLGQFGLNHRYVNIPSVIVSDSVSRFVASSPESLSGHTTRTLYVLYKVQARV